MGDIYSSLQIFTDRLMPDNELYKINVRETPTHRFGAKGKILQRWPALLSTSAVAVASAFPIDSPQVQGLQLGGRRLFAPDHNVPKSGIPVGVSDVPGVEQVIYLNPADMPLHTDMSGQPGTGKSMLMLRMFIEQIKQGYGGILIDPHAQLANALLSRIPAARREDVILFEPGDPGYAIPFNIFKQAGRP